MVVSIDTKAVPFDSALQGLIHGLEKIVAMRLDMKADQIRTQQPVQQFALPRTDPERLGVWPRDMPKNGDAGIRTLGLDHAGEQCKVVVLNQHEWPVRAFNLFENCFGKFLIDALVALPIRGPKNGTRMGNMAKRPNSFVREAEVIALFIFFR